MKRFLGARLELGAWKGWRAVNGAGSDAQECGAGWYSTSRSFCLMQLRQCISDSRLPQNWSAANCKVSNSRCLLQTNPVSKGTSASSLTPWVLLPTPCWEQSIKFWSKKMEFCYHFHVFLYRNCLRQRPLGHCQAYGVYNGSPILNETNGKEKNWWGLDQLERKQPFIMTACNHHRATS